MKKFFAITAASFCLSPFAFAQNKQVTEEKPTKLAPACLKLAEKFIAAQQTIDDTLGVTDINEYKAVIDVGDTTWAFTFAAPSWFHDQECRILNVSVLYY